MTLWIVCIGLGWFGLKWVGLDSNWRGLLFSVSVEQKRLRRVMDRLTELEDQLGAGLVPDSRQWAALAELPSPWGELCFGSLESLRSQGGAVLPTLTRLRSLARDHDSTLAQARARSAQALLQALVCGGMIPLFGTLLYLLLPGPEARLDLWLLICSLGALLAGGAMLWIFSMTDQARWAGLAGSERGFFIAAPAAGERFLAAIRAGSPPDLAWNQATVLLGLLDPELARRWGNSIWKPVDGSGLRPASRLFAGLGESLKKTVQMSLMEGKPCVDRVEALLSAFRRDIEAAVERELQLLPTRALRPLFLFVAPALFGMLGAGFWLTWLSQGGRGGI